ncbi:MAG TPA: hypothetical protein VHO72_17180 [Bacteroidales bacterium]|nr:hypothetical protein [Bacteroidales bacterium]
MDPEQKFKLAGTENSDSKVRFNKRVFIYLFFLFISIIFWYLNALSRTHTADLHCKLNYQSFPKGKVLISDLPAEVTLKVEGLGFQILKYKIRSFYSVIDLNLSEFRININTKDNQYHYFLLMRYTKDRINSMFSGINVIKVSPDTMFFQFTDVVDKKLPIRPDLRVEFEKQFMVHGRVHVIPDCVLISGPQAMMDTLRFISTSEIKKSNVKDTFVVETHLKNIPRFIIPKHKIKVFVPVDKYTEATLNVPIEALNLPSGIDIKTFPSSISLSCLVAVSDFGKITPQMFKAAIDYEKIALIKPENVKVSLIKIPSQVRNVKFHPKNVEYIIEK